LKKEDFFLLIIFILLSSSIIIKSFFHVDGYLSSDSHNYLSLAQNLLEKKGFYTQSNLHNGNNFFSLWPIGYSFFIFLVSKFFNLSVFWASKFLNVFFIGLILINFKIIFRKNAYLYATIFLFASNIDLFSYTWSETMFIVALIWFSSSLKEFIKNPEILFLTFISLSFSTLFLFLSRYAGIYSLIILLLFTGYFVYLKNFKKATLITGIFIINLLFIAFYLSNNYSETNFIFGESRSFFPREISEFILILAKALIGEIIIIDTHLRTTFFYLIIYSIYILIFCRFLFDIYKNKKLYFKKQNDIFSSKLYGLLGLLYYLFIIILSYTIGFDSLNYRLLAPGSILIFIAIINFLNESFKRKYIIYFKFYLILIAFFSWIIHFPVKTLIN
jgi:hypothetical protein